ncbi:hypothetical protein D3C76_1298660 [compost metagenome]
MARVTTSGEPVTGADTEAVYTTVPPSTTLGVAVKVTVDVSMLSLIVVTALWGLIDSCSKLPPVAPVMVAVTVEPLL